MVLEEEEEAALLAEAATRLKHEAIFANANSSKPDSTLASKRPSMVESHHNTAGKGDLPVVINQLQNHIDNISNHQTNQDPHEASGNSLISRLADVNNMENPRPSNYDHLRNILPENFPLEGIVRDRITSFAQVMKTQIIALDICTTIIFRPLLPSVINIGYRSRTSFSLHNHPFSAHRLLFLPFHLMYVPMSPNVFRANLNIPILCYETIP